MTVPTAAPHTRVAVAQMRSGPNVEANLTSIADLAAQAAGTGASLVAFPEYATFLGDNSLFSEHAESIENGRIVQTVSDVARANDIAILLGSTVETGEGGKVHNTSVLLDRTGKIVSKYRKIHLFSSTIPGAEGIESKWITPGDEVVVTDWQDWRIGLSVCFDVRFPELYRELSARGADVLTIPAAFVAATGKDHWEVLLRARAIENLAYVLAPAQIGPYDGGSTYGRSCIIDPWGTVLAVVGDEGGTGIAVAELKHTRLHQVRSNLPALQLRRFGRPAVEGQPQPV